MRKIAAAVVCFCACSNAAFAESRSGGKFWPQWRGPHATGVAKKSKPPTEWSETKNVRWKVAIPGQGHATPIVWGDRVYVQTAVKTEKRLKPKGDAPAQLFGNDSGRDQSADIFASGYLQPEERRRRGGRGRRGRRRRPKPTQVHKFSVLALNRLDGKVVWEKSVCEELPHESLHPDSTQASNSPVTDGKHLYAYFGSRGLYCLDMDGNLKWKKNFGKMRTRNSFGEGSSPVLFGDAIVVNWDHEDDSFIVALHKKTGEQLWKVNRDEPTSWSTPIVVEHEGKPQVVTASTGYVRSYDLKSGDVLWRCGGLTSNVISTPVSDFGMIFAMSGRRGDALLAIRYPGATGDITDSKAVVWQHDKDTSYVPSPLLYDDTLYFLKRSNAILSCFNAKTGKKYYAQQRLEGVDGVYASPVGADGRVYIAGRNGTTVVIKRGPEFEVLATNFLDDGFDASPAIAGNELYLRGRRHLYCIATN
ncbi:MAG: PQQ-like beta-propeller repeat protein [Phycisphaerales bacterium]|nr:PQQ-like beta-propeller repeat protein [Phycisphaerales bacterium]